MDTHLLVVFVKKDITIYNDTSDHFYLKNT